MLDIDSGSGNCLFVPKIIAYLENLIVVFVPLKGSSVVMPLRFGHFYGDIATFPIEI